MKVIREEESFKPVTIVLESQLEVDAMSDIAALMDCYTAGDGGVDHTKVRGFFSELNLLLQAYATSADDFMYVEEPKVCIQYKAQEEDK